MPADVRIAGYVPATTRSVSIGIANELAETKPDDEVGDGPKGDFQHAPEKSPAGKRRLHRFLELRCAS
jgi:hypothetical protein